METITKPDRLPDHIESYGSAYWWQEMVYVGGNGHIAKMRYDGDNSKLYMIGGGDGKMDRAFADNIRDKYTYWLYGAFEDAILTSSEDRT